MNVKGLVLCSLLLAPALCRAQEGRGQAEEVTPGVVVISDGFPTGDTLSPPDAR